MTKKKRPTRVLFFLLLFLPSFFVSCASFPKPTEEKNSLLVFLFNVEDARQDPAPYDRWQDTVFLTGPESVAAQVAFSSQEVVTVPVRPGTYTLQKRIVRKEWNGGGENRYSSLPFDQTIEVPANSIVLVPYRFFLRLYSRGSYAPSYWDLKTDEIAKISEQLTDTIGFSEWIGKLCIGFGQHPPRMSLKKDEYRLRLVSEPAGAEVIVDSERRGQTPTAVDLKAGKHLVELRKEGFSAWRNYIDVDSDTEITSSLKNVDELRKEGGALIEVSRNQYGLLVAPFRNIGNENEGHLQNVFHESLSATLSQDARISVFKTPDDAPKTDDREKSIKPDFSPAVKQGADLMVAGDYYVDKGDLLIHAALYDVQKESVKADILYASKTGLSIFDSIDEMTQKFGAAVDNVLPESGKQIVERKEVVETEIASLEKKVSQKDVIEKRGNRRSDLSVAVGFGACLDSITSLVVTLDRPEARTGMQFDASVGYTYHFSNFFGLTAMLGGSVSGEGNIVLAAPDGIIYFGPEFSTNGMLVDLYLRVLGQLRFGASAVIHDRETDEVLDETGKFTYYGLTIDSGVKFYTYSRYSSPGWYANLGFRYSPLLYREGDKEPNAEKIVVPLQMEFYAGLGVRL